ncbi:MAG: type VI secretion system tube protein Hcp [Pseudomonadota bacterium]
MSGSFMRVDGITDFKGMATVKEINSKKGYFPISNFDVAFSRSIYVAVGASGDAEVGVPAVSDVAVQRKADNASAVLSTLFFAPSDKGKTIEIVETKQSNDGKGLIPVKIITMEESRLSSYNSNGGGTAMTLAYTTIAITYYYEDSAGKPQKGDTVKFDLKTGTLESGNQEAMK